MPTYVDLIGWDDAPHLHPPYVSPQKLDDLLKDTLPSQRVARRTGRPTLGAGAIYPIDEEDLIIPPFEIPDHWERAWAMDVGWVKTAAIVAARDPDQDMYYLIAEYYRGEQQPLVHAAGIEAILPWEGKKGCIDPAANGRGQKDGSKLMKEYQDLNLKLVKANNRREGEHAGLHRCLVLMEAGRLKVFSSLVNWLFEFRLYHRDEKGNIVKSHDHLMDCMRYVLFTKGIFETKVISDISRMQKIPRGEF